MAHVVLCIICKQEVGVFNDGYRPAIALCNACNDDVDRSFNVSVTDIEAQEFFKLMVAISELKPNARDKATINMRMFNTGPLILLVRKMEAARRQRKEEYNK